MDFPEAYVRDELYPAIEPYKTGYLDLDGLHQMYWEESGNPKGVPVLVLHGGPGAGTSPSTRCFFDPSYYRIILYDQRGAGKSLPLGELKDNTTPHLIADIEKLRVHLGVEKWYIFGGSWGSTLGIAYAEAHPSLCLGLIFRGIFLCRRSEFEWVLWGVKTFCPEEYRKFMAPLKPEDQQDWQSILKAYYKLLTDPDPAVYKIAARVWSVYEGTLATLLPNAALVADFAKDNVALGIAPIEAHYFIHDIFLPENDLLNKIDRIRHIPGVIVHGRYDLLCPIVSADDVVQRWPEVDYRIIPDAGHSAFEPGIRRELVKAMEEFKNKDNQQERKNVL
ncbi:MAG: prolyl aminopeptidase [Alphaproteobacteria bacterium 41-28]|nr:MAG: prolyl aminopeptidase [Alphaproteobacteria bacterium 41-28]